MTSSSYWVPFIQCALMNPCCAVLPSTIYSFVHRNPQDSKYINSESNREPDWRAVLKLTTLWRFLEFRKQAIEKLRPQLSNDPHGKVLLGRQYHVYEWVGCGYNELVQRSQSLSMEEIEALGYPAAVRVLRMREHFMKKEQKCQSCKNKTVQGRGISINSRAGDGALIYPASWSIYEAVDREFKAELKATREASALLAPTRLPSTSTRMPSPDLVMMDEDSSSGSSSSSLFSSRARLSRKGLVL
jgi:hypothetical protein